MKRILSLVVCFLMILSLLPATTLFAAESVSYTVVQETPVSLIPKDNSTVGAWYINGSTFTTTPGSANYIEIAEEGNGNAGSLHVYQDNVTNSDMSIGMFLGGQAAGTYTVKLQVKGDLGYKNQTCKFYPYGCDAQAPNLHTYLDTTDVADWTEISYEITVANTFYYLIFSFSKYNWATNFYADNIQLLNSSGVNVLGTAGSFYTNQEVTVSSEDTNQWPDEARLDTNTISSAYGKTLTDAWTPMYPTGTPGDGTTWPAWDETHYAEVSANGYKDAGSLHLVSCATKNTGVAIQAGMTVGETYTLGFYAKGTVNTGRVLALYGNGDGILIANTAALKPGWNYYEHTFTAGLSQINIVAADWGSVDIYLDNITLTNSDGEDILSGKGDFCTAPEESNIPVLDTSKLDDSYDAPTNEWVPFSPYAEYKSTWPAWETGVNYGEIVEDGCNDEGALHLVSAGSKNTGVVINPQMVKGESYTIGMYVKGTANSNKVLAVYGNGGESGGFTFIGNPTYCGDVCLSSVPADWTYIEKTFTADRNSLAIHAADWGVADIYIDNITLINSAGKDLLKGYGDFCLNNEEPEEPTQPEYQDPTEEGWIGRDEYDQLELGVDYDYSFAILGDIQHITDYTPTDLPYLFDYILDNKDSKNIQFVFGMGDTTNDNHNEANNLREWKLAQEQFFRFNDVIPYTVIRGNHDVVARMNAYFADPNKPGYTDQLDGFYQEGSVVNVWKEFSVFGVDYLSLLIDYESSDSVLSWAADVIESHPNHRVIVNTHVYMNPDGTYDNEMNPKFADVGTINNAQQVWDKLISRHENIFMVLCGHTSTDDVLIQQKTGVHGNQITEIRVDSQYTDLVYMNKDGDVRGGPENGVGMVTLMYFKEDGTQVAMEHYSVLRQWYRQLQTFEIEEYPHYGWRYENTEADIYQPDTQLAKAPAVLQNGLGDYDLQTLLGGGNTTYCGTSAAIIPDHNMNLGTHTYALHSGSRTVEPGQTYTISYQIKGLSSAGKTWSQIHFCRSALGGSDTWESQWNEDQIIQGPVSDWQTVSYDVTMDDKTSAIEIYYIVNGSSLLIDNVSIVKKGSSENIITNAGFESGTDGQYPTGFYAMKTGGIGKVEKVSGLGVDGSCAVRVEPRPGYLLKSADPIAVTANTRYTVSWTMRVKDAVTDVIPVIYLYDSQGNMETICGETVSGKTDWKTVDYTFQTKEDTVSVQIGLLVYGGRVDADNLSLTADGTELLTNGNFSAGLQGFTGEFVQGLQQGTLKAVSAARPDSLIVEARVENNALNAYDGETLLGTVDWLYGQLEHKVNFGLRISDAETAQVVAHWLALRGAENLWVISDNTAVLDTVLAANETVRAVLDGADAEGYEYVLISDVSQVSALQQAGKKVILLCDAVTEEILHSGADAVLTGDSLAAIGVIETAEAAISVKQWNLSLGENIGVNFYLDIAEEKLSETVVTVKVAEETLSLEAAKLPVVNDLYQLSIQVAAAQMTENIEIFVDGAAVGAKTYSVRQYADYILAGSYDSAIQALVREMLSYGAAAQTYFEHNEEALANDGMDMTGVCTAEIPEAEETAMALEGKITGLSFYGASLIFESKTAVRFYFQGDVTDCSFSVGGKELPVSQKNGVRYVEIGEITPDALDQIITVTVTQGQQVLTVSYSPMNYIVRMNGKASTSANLKALLKAMYNYHLAACKL